MSAEVQVDVTRLTMTVGEVSFELEWKSSWPNVHAPVGPARQWQVEAPGGSFTAWRRTLEEAKALAIQAAPIVASLREARARAAGLVSQLRDLEPEPKAEAERALASDEADDAPPF